MKMIQFKITALALCAGLFITSCGSGNENSTTEDSMTMGEKVEAGIDSAQAALQGNPDQDFIKDAVEMNTKEIAWLKAGVSMGTDAEVKKHAKMMLADHEAVGKSVAEYATKKGLELPTLDTAGVVDNNEKKGKDWDKKWADKMVDEHEKAISRFEKAEKDVKDEELRTMISSTLPKLRSHLDMMKPLKEKLDK